MPPRTDSDALDSASRLPRYIELSMHVVGFLSGGLAVKRIYPMSCDKITYMLNIWDDGCVVIAFAGRIEYLGKENPFTSC